MEKIKEHGNIRIKKVHTLQSLHIIKAEKMLPNLEAVVDLLIDNYKK